MALTLRCFCCIIHSNLFTCIELAGNYEILLPPQAVLLQRLRRVLKKKCEKSKMCLTDVHIR